MQEGQKKTSNRKPICLLYSVRVIYLLEFSISKCWKIQPGTHIYFMAARPWQIFELINSPQRMSRFNPPYYFLILQNGQLHSRSSRGPCTFLGSMRPFFVYLPVYLYTTCTEATLLMLSAKQIWWKKKEFWETQRQNRIWNFLCFILPFSII